MRNNWSVNTSEAFRQQIYVMHSYLFDLRKFPLFVLCKILLVRGKCDEAQKKTYTKRTVASGTQPFRYAIEVENMPTVTPGNAQTFFWRWRWICLIFDAWFMQTVTANSASIGANWPRPHGNCVPLSHESSESRNGKLEMHMHSPFLLQSFSYVSPWERKVCSRLFKLLQHRSWANIFLLSKH